MKPYNGFEPNQRMAALRWLRNQQALGRRGQPTQCYCCGQMRGPLELHSEDYSAPYGQHIGAYELCYVCHMMIHCRANNPDAWERYKGLIARGWRLQAFTTRDFRTFCNLLLNKRDSLPRNLLEPADGADLAVFAAIEARTALPYGTEGKGRPIH